MLATLADLPQLPTYASAAAVCEQTTGAGWALAGWTVARMALIAPPIMAVGVPTGQAVAGAALASALISLLTLARVKRAGES